MHKEKKPRQTNIEILRILCMFFIVLGHLDNCIKIGLMPHAVNCFMLISGFFLITSKFKFERVLRTVVETFFYSFIITIILFTIGEASTLDIIKSAMPFAPTRFSYWFVNKYVAILLLSPFICKICTGINKKQYQMLLVSLLLISSTLILIFPFGALYGNGFSLLWMVTLFITGGYLKLHTPIFKYWGTATLLLLIIYNICNYYLSNIIQLQYNSLITYTLSITTFLWFKDMQKINSETIVKVTNYFAPHVFAVYLIHAQCLMNEYITSHMHKLQGNIPNWFYLLLLSLIIMIVSILIDKFRILLFRFVGINYIVEKLSIKINKLYAE